MNLGGGTGGREREAEGSGGRGMERREGGREGERKGRIPVLLVFVAVVGIVRRVSVALVVAVVVVVSI